MSKSLEQQPSKLQAEVIELNQLAERQEGLIRMMAQEIFEMGGDASAIRSALFGILRTIGQTPNLVENVHSELEYRHAILLGESQAPGSVEAFDQTQTCFRQSMLKAFQSPDSGEPAANPPREEPKR